MGGEGFLSFLISPFVICACLCLGSPPLKESYICHDLVLVSVFHLIRSPLVSVGLSVARLSVCLWYSSSILCLTPRFHPCPSAPP